jgi:type IV secretory pathway TraG/TraD family ATPase VirD4
MDTLQLHELSILLTCTGAPCLFLLAIRCRQWRTWLYSPLSILVTTAIGAVLWYLLRTRVLPPTANPTLQYASGLLFFIGLGTVAGFAVTANRPDTTHKRGTRIDDGRTLQRRRYPRNVITLAQIPIDEQDEPKHFKLIGTTGTGKSTAIREILASALVRGDRAIIADPDGAYAARFYDAAKGDAILNPFDERSHRWDLFREIHQPYDIDQLARALIPDSDGEERAWRAYARTFFIAVTRQLWESGLEQPQQRHMYHDVDELYRLLTIATNDELRILVQETPAQPFLENANERMFGSIRSVTANNIAALDFIREQRAQPLSIRQWIRAADSQAHVPSTTAKPLGRWRRAPSSHGHAVASALHPVPPHANATRALFLPYSATQIAALRSIISAWLRLAIFETMNGDERGAADSRRLWFVIDELDALGTIDGLKDALARLRKFGGRCVLGFQSIAQVRDTYGDAQAQTIVENCGTTLILRCSASEQGGTAKFASRLIGEREVIREQTSVSRSRQGLGGPLNRSRTTSHHHLTEDAVLASEVEQLPDLQGYLKLASSPVWLRVALPLKP